MQTWIIHIDMDAFFASVEQLDHPEWRGLPVVVGGGDRGVVAASSYEARKYGIRSAMPMFRARALCPHAVFTPGRKGRYSEISSRIMGVLGNFSPLVEPASIDEAYLDASGLERLFGPIENLGARIKAGVKEETGLTCSVGAAPIKFLAKIASDLRKPDGLSVIRAEDVDAFLLQTPLERIPGLGGRTLQKLASCGICTVADARRYPEEFWLQRLGKFGKVIYDRCRGIDPRQVEPCAPAKSEGAENTFERNIADPEALKGWLLRQAERVGTSLRRHGHKGRTVTIKAKFADFRQVTRNFTLPAPTNSTRLIYESAAKLLEELNIRAPLRLIGLSVSNFGGDDAEPPRQAALPGLEPRMDAPKSLIPGLDLDKEEALDQALDKARSKFGSSAVVRGKLFDEKKNE